MYFIGECTRPDQDAKCDTCGEKIGGLSNLPLFFYFSSDIHFQEHVLKERNTEANITGTAPKGYVIQEDTTITSSQREMNPLTYRLLRLIINICLWFHSLVNEMKGEEDILKKFTQNSRITLEKLINQDWKMVSSISGLSPQDLIYSIHIFLFEFKEKESQNFQTEDQRLQFEIDFMASVTSVFSNLTQKIQQFIQMAQQPKEFLRKLTEMKPIEEYSNEEKRKELPNLMKYRKLLLRFDELQNTFFSVPKNVQQYRLLTLFFEMLDKLKMFK